MTLLRKDIAPEVSGVMFVSGSGICVLLPLNSRKAVGWCQARIFK